MKTLRFLPFAVLLAVAAVVLAGCGGGGSKSVPQDAVAVVGSDTITKAQFNTLMDSAKSTYKARKTAFPKVGTPQWDSLKNQAVTYLVQESELEQKGKELGVTVTAKDVDARIAQIKTQYFQNSDKKYEAELKATGLTDARLRDDLRAQLLSEKLFQKVTSDVKVSDSAVKAYYSSHKSSYTTAASRTVRHILVNSKSLADQLESQLKGGADFAALAKKYSKDPQSAKVGGKLTISKGQTVKPFEDAAFSLKTNEISAPVHSTYGWHIIQPLGPVTPAKTTPFSAVKEQIRQSLLSTKKTQTMTDWVDQLKKSYAKKVSYQAGYEPPATSTSTTTTATTG
ncbi:MAG TPA: peptidylprolyl isomerase [Gaiellaceae bacterium]|nr:peptidylprolyl isomerase [Gaiellaceae bacterium]